MSRDWAIPRYTVTQVDAAGKRLAKNDPSALGFAKALHVLEDWRSAHSYPLDTSYLSLEKAALTIDSDCLVARRLKRRPAILAKLQRLKSMRLSSMQDIAGCRVIFASLGDAITLRTRLLAGHLGQKVASEKNYVDEPKDSGYRGFHLVLEYRGESSPYDGMSIEIQVRTRLQHAWATAVETMGMFLRQSLKSSVGSKEWLRYFALAGSCFAIREGTAPIPETPRATEDLLAEISALERRLAVMEKLRSYGKAVQTIARDGYADTDYFLLVLQPVKKALEIVRFENQELADAMSAYLQSEAKLTPNSSEEVVLVSAGSLANVRKAYPNYFLDTDVFLEELGLIITNQRIAH